MKTTVTLLSLLFIQHIIAQSTNFEPSQILPDSINLWEPAIEERHFNEENLYDYIDGGAELFLSFGFNNVFNRIYSREDQPDIFVDIFEMKTSYDAYGVFSQSREKVENQFGQESQYTQGAVLFWKDNYYVSLISSIETEESKEAIILLAEIINKAISLNGPKPQIVKLLPKQNLIEESIRYFRHHHWQNAYLFISFDNILNINQNTHAVLAKYNYDNDKPLLLIVDYINNDDAEKAYNKFIDNYLLESENNRTAMDKEGNLVGIDIMNNIVAVVFNSKSEETVNILLDAVKK